MKSKIIYILIMFLMSSCKKVFEQPQIISDINYMPFDNLVKADVKEIELFIMPPETNINLSNEQIMELIPIMNKLVIYEEVSPQILIGQMVQCQITMLDGDIIIIKCLNPYLVIDEIWYKTEYDPCEEMNKFANELLN